MEISKAYCEKIAKTLPIGYYADRNIPITLDEYGQESYYDTTEDTITISLSHIEKALQNMGDKLSPENAEQVIRGLLYHEVSHALLTPSSLMELANSSNYSFIPNFPTLVNIFEDERIETLLSEFYMGVDFKQNVLTLNNFDSPADLPPYGSVDNQQKFFSASRFRYAPQEILDEVNRIIKKYAFMNCNDDTDVFSYLGDIKSLANKIGTMSAPPTPPSQPQNLEDMKKEQEKVTHDKALEQRVKGANGNDENENEGEAQGNDGESDSEGKDNDDKGHGRTLGKSLIRRVINCSHNEKLVQEINDIFNTFNNRSKANNSATCGYSGILNPRLVARDDYRYFTHKCDNGSIKGFSKLHLNLFVDDSGSFNCNVQAVNELLFALAKAEKSNTNFDFTLIRCGRGQEICPDNDRHIYADQGTCLTDDICEQFIQVQKPQSVNYNILLYDGGAGGSQKAWQAFNKNNCAIIYEDDNAYNVEKYCKIAKKIYVRGNYAEHLTENVLNILKCALN